MHIITNNLRQRAIALKRKDIAEDTIKVMLKEILQDFILAGIYSDKLFRDMVFIGGTALRKLYELNRFSEDIDFNVDFDVDYEALGNSLKAYFDFLDFKDVEYSIQHGEHVSRLTIKFKILKEVGLSNFEDEKLHVKVETTKDKLYDVKPFTKNLANTPIIVKSYPLPTLMSGKVCACLNRTFVKGNTGITIKGRDYYDLIWYMSQGIMPNEQVLTDSNPDYTVSKVFEMLDEKVEKITSRDLMADLAIFFESKSAIQIWCDNFQELYANYRNQYRLN